MEDPFQQVDRARECTPDCTQMYSTGTTGCIRLQPSITLTVTPVYFASVQGKQLKIGRKKKSLKIFVKLKGDLRKTQKSREIRIFRIL